MTSSPSAAHDHRYRSAMWIFLASETLLFAGLFALFASYHDQYPAEFAAGGARAVAWVGVTNTAVLLCSSFLVASAIRLVRLGRVRLAAALLVGAIGLGALFLALKLYEWHVHLDAGIAAAGGARLYITLYFLMTGLHALHLVAGMTLLAWIVRAIAAGRITRRHPLRLELVGLYWHFVDVVWLFLWPLFYLVHA